MSIDESDATLEERRLHAERLVSQLDTAERLALDGLSKGLSRKAIAATAGRSLDDVERTLAGLMKKLQAKTIADAVRIAIYANLSSPH